MNKIYNISSIYGGISPWERAFINGGEISGLLLTGFGAVNLANRLTQPAVSPIERALFYRRVVGYTFTLGIGILTLGATYKYLDPKPDEDSDTYTDDKSPIE